MKVIICIVLIAWSYFGSIFYGAISQKLTRGREPWFTIIMLSGLVATIYITSLVSGATLNTGIWTLAVAGALFLAMRLYFGKSSSIELFVSPHLIAVFSPLLLPLLYRH
jgi:hypothetical protein